MFRDSCGGVIAFPPGDTAQPTERRVARRSVCVGTRNESDRTQWSQWIVARDESEARTIAVGEGMQVRVHSLANE